MLECVCVCECCCSGVGGARYGRGRLQDPRCTATALREAGTQASRASAGWRRRAVGRPPPAPHLLVKQQQLIRLLLLLAVLLQGGQQKGAGWPATVRQQAGARKGATPSLDQGRVSGSGRVARASRPYRGPPQRHTWVQHALTGVSTASMHTTMALHGAGCTHLGVGVVVFDLFLGHAHVGLRALGGLGGAGPPAHTTQGQSCSGAGG